MTDVSLMIPGLCGIGWAKRRLRWLVMINCFVDDSGNSADDPVFALAGWAGKVETWNAGFCADWQAALTAPKPIDYYKHSEAARQESCFKGFTVQEATQKTIDMARVVSRYHIYPFAVTVPLSSFKSKIVEGVIEAKRGNINKRVRSRFIAAFGYFVPFVLKVHYDHFEIREEIDFIIDSGNDEGDKVLREAMTVYGKFKQEVARPGHPEHRLSSLMGEVIPRSDKKMLPLQAADLLAGQIRREFINGETPVALRLWEEHGKRVYKHEIPESDMKTIAKRLNPIITQDWLDRAVKKAMREDDGKKKTIYRI